MNKIPFWLMANLVTTALLSPLIVHAGPTHRLLTEDATLNVLLRTLKHDHVYSRRISLDCIMFATEEKTDSYFEFVLRENHTSKCGGDPETIPVIDRYRVYRASGKIEWLDPVEDNWQRYNPARIRS